LAVQVDACNKILPDNLMITVVGPDLTAARAYEYNEVVPVVGEAHVAGLVKAAVRARATMPSELRVIVHPLVDPKPTFGITKFGPYDGEHFGTVVILNASLQRDDNLTLLHEMIHATGLLIHDSEPGGTFDETSVFSTTRVATTFDLTTSNGCIGNPGVSSGQISSRAFSAASAAV
jgi:hypothetical protein